MTNREKANAIVRNNVIWAMGAGLVPIPIIDVAAVTSIQVNMIRQLCDVYKIEFSEQLSQTLISALAGSTLARLGASAFKLIPGVGTLLGGGAMSALSGATTYAVGEVFINHFEVKGTLNTFEPEKWKQFFEQWVEKGKEYVQEFDKKSNSAKSTATSSEPNTPADDTFTKLEKLNQLRQRGIITDEEFTQKKQDLLNQL